MIQIKSNKIRKLNEIILELKKDNAKSSRARIEYIAKNLYNYKYEKYNIEKKSKNQRKYNEEKSLSITTNKKIYTVGEIIYIQVNFKERVNYHLYGLDKNQSVFKFNKKNRGYLKDNYSTRSNNFSGYDAFVALSSKWDLLFYLYPTEDIERFILGHLKLTNDLPTKKIEDMYKYFDIDTKVIFIIDN